MQTYALAALLVGLAGGVHCAGMCGGIVAALSFGRGGPNMPGGFLAAYNAGRIASYTVAGTIAGSIGHSGLALRGTIGLQQTLFGFASLALVLSGLYLSGHAAFMRRAESVGAVLWRRIEPWSRPLIPVTTVSRALGLGILWGWLPCAMAYGALLLALSSGTWWGGALTMAAFGVGTLPNLLGMGLVVRSGRRYAVGPRMRLIAGLLVAGLGLWGFVQIGMSLTGIGEFCSLPAPHQH